jgi:hypothetical protein
MVEKITMSVDESLELDYLVEKINDDAVNIINEPSNASTTLDYIKTQSTVFDPPKTGKYTFDIDSQTIEIEVTDIPDRAIHRWKINEGSGTTLSDSIGSANGTVNGSTWVSNNWTGGYALDGNGTDNYIDVGTLGNFGSNMDSDFAIALTLKTTNGNGRFCGIDDDPNGAFTAFYLTIGDYVSEGQVNFLVRDEDQNEISITTDDRFDDGSQYRFIFNKTSNNESGLEIWANASEESTSDFRTESFSNPANFNNPVYFQAYSKAGEGDLSNVDCIIDDIIIFDDALAPTQIQDDYDRQPWSP